MSKHTIRRRLHPAPLAFGLALGCGSAFPAMAADDATGKEPVLPPRTPTDATKAATTKAAQPQAVLTNPKGKGPELVKENDGSESEHWVVTASPMNTLRTPIGISRMPQDVLHTPQTIDAEISQKGCTSGYIMKKSVLHKRNFHNHQE
ncbi:hypothetical protein AD954_13265, partial [Acetobacter cerevisiae]